MPEFVANNLLFSFGDQRLVQERLGGLIHSLEEYVLQDRLCLLFCRFCKLIVRLADSRSLQQSCWSRLGQERVHSLMMQSPARDECCAIVDGPVGTY